MITKTQLREEHDAGLGDRPQRIQRLRQAFRVYCDLSVPRAVADVPAWYRSHSETITERLTDDGGGD